jgi:hypothetical protein
MQDINHRAANIVAAALAGVAPGERGALLRCLLSHVTAGIVVIEGASEGAAVLADLQEAITDRARKA